MSQAIETRYICPTNFRGARIKATAWAGQLTLSWDHALNPEENHDAAARAFAKKFGWYGVMVRGSLKKGGNVYCFLKRFKSSVKRVGIKGL